MAVPSFLNDLEHSGLSVWLRESPSVFGFYFILVFHTIGLALVVGPNTAIDLRLLGFAPEIPLPPLKNWFNLIWLGLAINVVSGIFLVLAYPSKAFTNPDFYLKLTLIAVAVALVRPIARRAFALVNTTRLKTLAVASLVCWSGAIIAGRLLAYTYSRLLANF